MIEVTKYMCSLCASEYNTSEEAEFCEALTKPESTINVGDDIVFTHEETGEERTAKVAAKYLLKFAKDGIHFHQFAYIVPNNEESWRIVLSVEKDGNIYHSSSDQFGMYTLPYLQNMVEHYQKMGVFIES